MKQITKTPDIIAKLQGSVGPDVNLEDLIVYEASLFNTLPLRKRHPLYKGAVASADILHAMASQITGESVPLHVMHSTDGLNIGRVFAGSVVNVGGVPELRGLFFLPKSAVQAAELIDTGTVDQVSVSFVSNKLLCSDCGFDFLGADATFDNIYGGICDQGHVLGEGQTHAKLIGLDRLFEVSLVNAGGAQKARIHSGKTSVFAPDHRLAASGIDPNFLLANCSTQDLGVMDLKELVDKLTETVAKLALTESKLEAAEAKIEAAEAKVAELEAVVADVPADAVALKAQLDPAVAHLQGMAKKVAPMVGASFDGTMTDVAKLIAFVDAGHEKLRIAVPLMGISQSAIEIETKKPAGNAGNFRTRKG